MIVIVIAASRFRGEPKKVLAIYGVNIPTSTNHHSDPKILVRVASIDDYSVYLSLKESTLQWGRFRLSPSTESHHNSKRATNALAVGLYSDITFDSERIKRNNNAILNSELKHIDLVYWRKPRGDIEKSILKAKRFLLGRNNATNSQTPVRTHIKDRLRFTKDDVRRFIRYTEGRQPEEF